MYSTKVMLKEKYVSVYVSLRFYYSYVAITDVCIVAYKNIKYLIFHFLIINNHFLLETHHSFASKMLV